MIEFIINTYHRSDDVTSLMPSETASYILREFINNISGFIDSSRLKNSQWMKLMENGNILWGVVNAGLCEIKRDDQQNRANAIVNTLINLNLKHICLMDGHGRIVYEIFAALQQRGENIDEYRIDVYEIDADVYEWHKLFFPKNVFSFHKDIFESVREDFRGILYLNFCNLSTDEMITKTINTIDTLTARELNVFVGFSKRNTSKYRETLTRRERFLKSSKKNRGRDSVFQNSYGKLISKAGDYITFEYSKQSTEQEQEQEPEPEPEQPRSFRLALKEGLRLSKLEAYQESKADKWARAEQYL